MNTYKLSVNIEPFINANLVVNMETTQDPTVLTIPHWIQAYTAPKHKDIVSGWLLLREVGDVLELDYDLLYF